MVEAQRMHTLKKQSLVVKQTGCSSGWILDLGGGGEGIIGKYFSGKIVAIDPLRQELEEAPEGPLKAVMDATQLSFLDGQFAMVTSFFTLMYINKQDQEQVFREAHRVLESGGRFEIWDAVIPKYDGGVQDIFVVPLEISVNGEVIETAYGISWEEKEQDLDHFRMIGENQGFKVLKAEYSGSAFYISLQKK